MNFPILSFLTFFPLVGVIFILLRRGSDEVVNVPQKLFQFQYHSLILSFHYSYGVNLIQPILAFNLLKKLNGLRILSHTRWELMEFQYFSFCLQLLFPLCIFAAINSLKKRIKEFLIAILIMQTFMIGVFCALDLFLFFLFFEGGLIPMFLIIGIWGGERRVYSALKFFLYTFLGSIFMLIAIIAIYWNMNTLDLVKLMGTKIPENLQYWMWFGFFISSSKTTYVASAYLVARCTR